MDGNPTIFIVHGLEGSAETFKPLADKLEASVYGFQFTKNHDSNSIEAIAQHYLSEIVKTQPSGPYNVEGFSGGSPIAYEIAQQLIKQNQEVNNLILLDGCPTYKGETEGCERTSAYDVLESTKLLCLVPDDDKIKFKESWTGDIDKDSNAAVELGKEFAGIEPDPEVFRKYLEFDLATKTYDPECKYDGEVVHIKASDPSSYTTSLPNED